MTAAPLAVSMGDPAGVGLELAVKAHAARTAEALPRFVLFGDPDAARRAAGRLGADVAVAELDGIDAPAPDGALGVVPVRLARPETPGAPDPDNAAAVVEAIRLGVAACLAGRARALVTAPIAKAPLYAAGFGFPGHTEYLAALTETAPHSGPRGPVMMLATAGLRVALATIHVPLAAAPGALNAERLGHVARVVDAALRRDFGVAGPRIALCGLNPHAGEGGGIGREEIDWINPAAAALRAAGIPLTDAQPADSLFHAEARAGYDAAIALYHDQGLIPVKTLDFWGAVNLTLGLPIVRASPDHGTAFDLAGQGRARPDSFFNALRAAAAMADRRAQAAA